MTPMQKIQEALDELRAAWLREPSEAMVSRAIGYVPIDPSNTGAAHHWRAMLAASPLGDK